MPSQGDDPFNYSGWQTDFSKRNVSMTEIVSGGPGRDGIPPIDDPKFAKVSSAPEYLSKNEPVISLEINGDARAYPLSILIWHEIVNDIVGGLPVSITYCPLCNSVIAFDRRVDDLVLDFGTTGLLRNSDLIMWDRLTESWWQQITGEAIVGEYTGTMLRFIPSSTVSWSVFKNSFPEGQVLTRDTGYDSSYNRPPYAGYDESDNRPFFFYGGLDIRLDSMERVIGLQAEGGSIAYPFDLLAEHPVIQDVIGEKELVIFFEGHTQSAFVSLDSEGRRNTGATGVFNPHIDGEKLSFRFEDGNISDEQTGSTWNVLGHATSGKLKGTRLTPIVHANHFWFAWQAFNPGSEIRAASDLGK